MNKNEQIKLKKKENVKFVSENLDKTNKELSEILGVSRSSISNYRKEAMALEAENELKENIDLEPATSDGVVETTTNEISEEDNESSPLYTYEFGINFINEDVLLEYLENYETLNEDIKQEISLIDFDNIILSKENEDKIKELAEDLSLNL